MWHSVILNAVTVYYAYSDIWVEYRLRCVGEHAKCVGNRLPAFISEFQCWTYLLKRLLQSFPIPDDECVICGYRYES
jgi:hypothetical protein